MSEPGLDAILLRGGGAPLIGDWFPSGGSNMILRAEVPYCLILSSKFVTVAVETKTIEEQDSDATSVTSITFDSACSTGDSLEGIYNGGEIKELVRYKITQSSPSILVLLRCLDPVFFEAPSI